MKFFKNKSYLIVWIPLILFVIYSELSKIRYSREDVITDRYSNGEIKEQEIYKTRWNWFGFSEKRILIINTFWENGNKKKTTFYDSNGQTIETRSYESGMLNGKVISYYEDGQIEEEFNYVDDNFDGKQIVYYPDGSIKLEGEYINGVPIGKVVYHVSENSYDIDLFKMIPDIEWETSLREFEEILNEQQPDY